jgi:predicted lactoylglutathione lyase
MVEYKLEVIVLPVADVDRAKDFYRRIGYASFSDPDGNGFLLQEVTERIPGR